MRIPDGYVVLFHDNHGKDVDFEVENLVLCKSCRYNPDNPRPFYDDDPIETYAWCKTEYFDEQGFCSHGKPAITLQPQEGEEE